MSLTCPNCYWGGPEVSLKAARIMNDDMAAARTAHPDRLRWFCRCRGSIPSSRCRSSSARARRARRRDGARQHRRPAADRSRVRADLAAIDAKALPVLVHPTAPPGVGEMDMVRFQLTASIGFTFDTSLAIARMIYDGFFDRYRS